MPMSGHPPTVPRAGMLTGWRLADERLGDAMRLVGLDGMKVEHVLISTPEEAEQRRFAGSPTILVDGEDPFAEEGAAVGLSCRLFRTSDGPAGAPTLSQLTEALRG